MAKSNHVQNYIDDWLDDEKGQRKRKFRQPAKQPEKPEYVPWTEANATVCEVFPKVCHTWLDAENVELLCQYRRNKVFSAGTAGMRERSPVAVGDRVKVTRLGAKDGIVEGICERRSKFSRLAPGRRENFAHVLAANVDLAVIVTSTHQPEFSLGLVDRFLVAALRGGIQPILCINKADLWNEGNDSASPPWQLYQTLGYECRWLSAKTGVGVAELRERLAGKKAVFCGHSGVGKTSLLAALLGAHAGRIGEVNVVTGKGRHTTTSALMLRGPGGEAWIDTPGIRGFALAGITRADLASYFPEFADLRCQGRGCLHELGLDDCEAQELPRHESYCRLLESIETSDE